MEIIGANAVLVGGCSVIVLGLVEWFKTPTMPKWAIRLISLGLSFSAVALTMLYQPMTWQLLVLNGVAVFLMTNGIWHTADTAKSTNTDNYITLK